MKITDLSIRYRTSIVILTVVLVLGGLYSYQTIPKEAQPSIEIPNIVVTTVYPGASPGDIESLLTQPIEQEIQSVTGIKEVRSTSTEGVSTIIVEFEPSVSMDDAVQKVREKVDLAKPELPNDVEEPIVSEIDMQDFPILSINLAAGYSLARLKALAEDLQTELEGINTVLEVDLIGGLDREVQVDVDLNALQGYSLTFEDVISTIQFENTNIPGGSVDVQRQNFLVRVDGEIENPEEINDLVIDTPDGQPVYVRDVADVTFGFKDRTTYSRLEVFQAEDHDGNLTTLTEEEIASLQVVTLNVKKRSGANILDTVDEVKVVLDEFAFPEGTRYVITGDMSYYVKEMVKDLENNIISGLFFVVAVLLFFLGVRNAFLVGIAIPLSMFISFILMQAMGYTLNFIILFSLIIALGMLVDNAVVIVENIYRYREMGHSRFESARLATGEVGGAVVASTATTVAAFAPMLFWPGMIGEFMSYLPLTLIITLSSSLFVAIIINPVITGIFVRLEGEKREKSTRAARLTATGIVIATALIIGLANWRTLVVLAIAIPTLIIMNRYFFKPVGERFVQTGLPRLLERYKAFLRKTLERDYSVRLAYLRNMGALGSFTIGFVLLFAGILLINVLGVGEALSLMFVDPALWQAQFTAAQLAPIIVLFLAIVLLAVGMLAIMGHCVEMIISAFMGGRHLILTDNRAKMLNGAMGALIVIIFLFASFPMATVFFPTTDPDQIAISFASPLGTNVDTSNNVALEGQQRIDDLLWANDDSRKNVKNVLTNVGVGGDMMFGGGASGPENSRITLNLIDYNDRDEKSTETMEALRRELKGIPGTEIEITQDDLGPPVGAPVNIEISGDEFDEIVRITRDIKDMLTEGSETGAIPGLVDVTDNLNTGRPELAVNIDRERAARFGLSTQQIASTVRAAINGLEAGKYRTGEDEYDIIVRLEEADRSSLESLKNLTILYEGEQIPLVAVADMEVQGGLGSITRLDQSRVATVVGKAAAGFSGPQVLGNVQAYMAEYETTIPDGYTITYTGESEEQEESFGFLSVVLMIGVVLIFMIMVIQFNRASSPFIIMVAVGLSLLGVLLGLTVTRTPFGLMTFIGIISLAGIVVNNNIVLIDYIMQLRNRGLEKQEAIIEGGATRLRPVVLTALTTILGLIPLTIGLNIDFVGLLTTMDANLGLGSRNTQFWGPMGISIISGLLFATFLTLVIVPVLYSTFESMTESFRRLYGRNKAPELAVAPVPSGNGHGDGFPKLPETPKGDTGVKK